MALSKIFSLKSSLERATNLKRFVAVQYVLWVRSHRERNWGQSSSRRRSTGIWRWKLLQIFSKT